MSETLEVFGKTYTNVAGIKASTPTGETRAFTIGTDDYEELNNLPSINDVELIGNKTAAQLGLAAAGDIPTVPVQSVNSKTGAVVLTASDVGAYALPANGIPDSDIASAATWNAKGTYSKPSGGIPKTDLASAVQTSLGKADTALQSHQSLAAYRTSADQDTIDATKITSPSNPASGESIVFDGTDWIAKATAFLVGGTISSTNLIISDARISAKSHVASLISLSADIGGQIMYWTTTDGKITFSATIPSPVTIYLLMVDIG